MRHRPEIPLLAAAVVIILGATTTTVALGVHATAGWLDQSRYHWPTIAKMITELPAVDVVNVRTATGPLFHLSLAVPARLLGLSQGAVEILAATYACLTAALVVFAGRGLPLAPRIGASGLVLLSPYLWESTLWIATDTAALAFAFAALLLIVGPPPAIGRRALAVGVLVAAAVGVRQTFAWLLVVAAVGLWFSETARPVRERLRDLAAGTLPGAAVLIALVVAWKGLVPPSLVELNATHRSPAGLTYLFALAAFFVTPVLLALWKDPGRSRRDWVVALAAGVLVALPGLVFPSSEQAGDGLPRSGGWLWVLVAHAPAPGARSVALVGLAVIGGAACCLVLLRVARARSARVALVLGTSLVTAALVASAGSQMYQKYYEMPLVVIVFLMIREVFRDRPPYRAVLALAPAVLQACAVGALVLLPWTRALG